MCLNRKAELRHRALLWECLLLGDEPPSRAGHSRSYGVPRLPLHKFVIFGSAGPLAEVAAISSCSQCFDDL